MLEALWTLAAANIFYLVYAGISSLKKQKKLNADELHFLDVPDQMLSAVPVAKQVTLRPVEAQGQWWDKKINTASPSVGRRHRKLEHNQLLLSDLDENF